MNAAENLALDCIADELAPGDRIALVTPDIDREEIELVTGFIDHIEEGLVWWTEENESRIWHASSPDALRRKQDA